MRLPEKLASWSEALADARAASCSVALWGAGSKGATFTNMLDPDGSVVSALVDKNPRKVGRFVPGTGQPIVAPEDLMAEAEALFRGLVALDAYEPYFMTALGSIAQRRDDVEQAEAWYSRAIDCDGPTPVARAHRGEIRLLNDDLENAVEDLALAIQEDPKFEEPTTERARALLAELKRKLDEIAN